MDSLGLDFNVTGSVMTKQELEESRKKRGECVTCGQKCFKKKLFKMLPLDRDGKVLNGRCLSCKPLMPRDILVESSTTTATATSISAFSNSTSTAPTARSSSMTSMNTGSNNNVVVSNTNGAAAVLTAAVSRRMPTSRANLDQFSRTQFNLQQRSIHSLQPSINSASSHGQQNSVSMATTSSHQQQIGSRASFHMRPPVSSLARHSFSNTAANSSGNVPLQPIPRARSERSLSSIGSASVISGNNDNNNNNNNNNNVSASRMTPTLPSGRRVLTADVPPATPVRTSSGSVSPNHPMRKQPPPAFSNNNNSKPDAAPGPPPPWAPPSLSPFVMDGKHQRSIDSKTDSAATPLSHEESRRASLSHQSSEKGHRHHQTDVSIPSQQELERAQQTILAAQQAGIYQPPPASTSFAASAALHGDMHQQYPRSYPTAVLEEPMEYTDNQKPHAVPPNVVIHADHNSHNSNRGGISNTMGRMESEVTIDTTLMKPAIIRAGMPRSSEDSSLVDSESAYEILPVHGVLNRGGAFVPPSSSFPDGHHGMSPRDSCRWSNGGGNAKHGGAMLPGKSSSFRTTSSLSSHEDDLHPQAHCRARIGNMADLFETSESSLSKEGKEDGNGTQQSGSRGAGGISRRGNVARTLSTVSGSRHSDNRSGSHKMKSDYFELVELLREAGGIPEVAATFLQEISSVQLEEDDVNHLFELHAWDVVLSTMSSCKESYEVQLCGCKVIAAMGGFKQLHTKLVDGGCVKIIIGATESFSKQPDLLVSAMLALSSLIVNDDSVDLFIKEQVVQAATNTLGNFSSHPSLFIKTCEMIEKLASLGSTSERETIAQNGAGESLFTAMVMNQGNMELQVSALNALNQLCVGADDNIVSLVNLGLCDVIVNAMENHRDEPDLQKAGARLIATLAVIDENKHAIGDNSGGLVLVRGICVHGDCVGVVEPSIEALSLLTLDLFIAEKLIQGGVIDVIVKAMQDHTDSSSIQEFGCATLANLAKSGDQVKMDIVDLGALDQINIAMVCHEHASGLHARACEAILWLAIDENIRAINALGLVQLAEKSSKRFPGLCIQYADQLIQLVDHYCARTQGQSS